MFDYKTMRVAPVATRRDLNNGDREAPQIRGVQHSISNRHTKLLETAATYRKHSSRVISNRDKTGGCRDAQFEFPPVARASCPRFFARSAISEFAGKMPAPRGPGRALLIGKPKRLEID